MFQLLLGIGAFALVLGITNSVLIKKWKLSYKEHFWLFSFIYFCSSLILFQFAGDSVDLYLSHFSFYFLSLVSLVFLTVGYYWCRIVVPEKCYAYDSVPKDFRSILNLSLRRNFTKLLEIIFQQLCSLLIVISLFSLGLDLFFIMAIFTIVSFGLHITSPKWFGKFYGNYFLWVATVLAPLEVYLLLEFSYGLYLATSLHIFMYLVMYSLAILKR